MDDGLKDLIEELDDYGKARKGELAGMVLEAANRLREMRKEIIREKCRTMIIFNKRFTTGVEKMDLIHQSDVALEGGRREQYWDGYDAGAAAVLSAYNRAFNAFCEKCAAALAKEGIDMQGLRK